MTQTNRFFIVAGTLGIVAISLFIFDATEGAEGPKSVFVHPIGLEGGVLRNEEYSMTPLLRQAKRLADSVAFMYLGELVEHGVAEQVFSNPGDERTRSYVSGRIG